MNGTFLEVIRADGRVDRHDLRDERVTVGSAPDATIRIDDAAEIEPLHLLLAPRDDGCWVSTARGARVTARRNGYLFENGVVPWGGELDVGAVMFRLARAEVVTTRRRAWLKHARKLVLLMACAYVGMHAFGARHSGPPRTNAAPPELLAEVATECPGASTEAVGRGYEALDAAEARAERYPFAPYDGVRAVHLFARARACLAAGGRRELASSAAREGERMRSRVVADYQFHRLRLERALDDNRYREALGEARIVAGLLRDHPGEYSDWLERLDRALEVRIAEQEDD